MTENDTDQLIEEYLDSLNDISDATKKSREFAVRDFLTWIEEDERELQGNGGDRR